MVLASLLSTVGTFAEQHPVSVSDCVGLRRIVDTPQLAPDGHAIAYIVKHPNLSTNRNEYEIRVRPVPGAGGVDNGRILATYHEQALGLRWLNGSQKLTILLNPDQTVRRESEIVELDRNTGFTEVVVRESQGITDYSASADGKTVAYLAAIKPTASDTPLLDKELRARGFAIPDDFSDEVLDTRGSAITGRLALWIARRSISGAWARSEINPPVDASFDGKDTQSFQLAYGLSMAPSGRYLAFDYQMQNPPDKWLRNRTVQAYRDEFAIMPHRLGLYDVQLRKFVDVPSAPFPHSIWWSDDSQSYASLSAAPLESKWETEDALANTTPRGAPSFHVFAVDIETLAISEVLSPTQAKGDDYSLLSWKHSNGTMMLEYDHGKSVVELTRNEDEWNEKKLSQGLPDFVLDAARYISFGRFVGVHQDANRPPDLWYIDDAKNSVPVQLTQLNPQAARFSMGSIENIAWKNGYGATVAGKLLMPPDADSSIRYPLVILLTWPNEEFVCDGHYTTSFAPQPLASAGFAVAIFNVYDAFGAGSSQPGGPPQTKEAESTVSSIEALVSYLDQRGAIDKDNVGVVGFSRSSWKVDYLITHSRIHLSAASSADGGIGNYGASWLNDRGPFSRTIETGYGGSFWGSARSAWLNGAPAFNANKVSTPLLMEYTGAESLLDEPYSAYEFHSALVNLGKPVELYFYPKGAHPLDSPFERVASLQRNVDWFRFWMQEYENPAPVYDRGQYNRWRRLRKLPDTKMP
jgi:dipeptidyl aminopeptidase/acylaminoacyl peptidase